MARKAPNISEVGLEVYLKQINESKLLTAQEECQLARAIRSSDPEEAWKARDRMIRSNLRLVVNIAKNFSGRALQLSDLIEEGNLGLLRAVEGFDPDQGSRFSTYASWWIKQSIKRALMNAGQPIHIPAYMVDEITRWKQASVYLEDCLGRPPSSEEVADHLKTSPKRMGIIKHALKAMASGAQLPEDDSNVDWSQNLPDDKVPSPEEKLLDESEEQMIRDLLNSIDQREATVLRMRYGLDGEEAKTLKQIGQEIGLTRERVRQIERDALQKLEEYLEKE